MTFVDRFVTRENHPIVVVLFVLFGFVCLFVCLLYLLWSFRLLCWWSTPVLPTRPLRAWKTALEGGIDDDSTGEVSGGNIHTEGHISISYDSYRHIICLVVVCGFQIWLLIFIAFCWTNAVRLCSANMLPCCFSMFFPRSMPHFSYGKI